MTVHVPTSDADALAHGMVPTARVAPILREAVKRVKMNSDFDFVAPWVGDADRALYRWENEVEYVGFDTVDRQFCRMHLDVHRIWTEDLADIYYGITFQEAAKPTAVQKRRCKARGCSNELSSTYPQAAYCSANCKARAYRERRRLREGRDRRTGGKYDRCVNGHDRSPENTNARGKCLVCKREQAKAKYHRDEAHRKKVVQNARRHRQRVKSRRGDHSDAGGVPRARPRATA